MSDINITIRLASKAAQDGLDRFGGAAGGAGKKIKGLQLIVKNTQSAFSSFIGNLGASVVFRAFSAITSGIGNAVTNMRDFESALRGVGKTTGLQGAELRKLGLDIEGLSKRIPVAATELLGLAQTAAQLGVVGTSNLIKFSETLARLASATNIVGEQGAINLARIINVTGETVSNVDKLGDSLVILGNNFATTESQILTVANEVAKGGARFGITAEETLGLATAMSALGTEAQVAGSTIQKIFSKSEIAIGRGGAELSKFSKVLGTSNAEFTKLFQTDPTQFFIQLTKGLARTVEEGETLSTTLADLGFQDLRVTKTLGPLITRTDLLTDAVNKATNARLKEGALNKESEAAFDTLDSSILKLTNSWNAFTNRLLLSVLPAMKLITDLFAGTLALISDFPKTLKIIGAALAGAAIAIVAGLITITVQAFLASGAFAALTTAAAASWVAILGPIALVIAGIASVTAAIVVLTDQTDKERIANLESARQRRIQSGLSIEAIDKEISKLKERIRLDFINNQAIEGNNTVRKERIRTTGELNALLAKQLFLEVGLAGIFATAGDDGLLVRLEKKRLEDEETARIKKATAVDAANKDALERLRTFGEAENALTLEQTRAGFLASDELAVEREEILLEIQANKLATELENEELSLIKKLGLQDKFLGLEEKNAAKQAKRTNEISEKRGQAELKLERILLRQKNNIQSASFGLAATIAKDGSKIQLIIQKAAAVAQLLVAKGLAIGAIPAQVALLPPPAVPAASAALLAQANLAFGLGIATVIASTIKGFEHGGIVGGSSFSGDKILIGVNSGERILTREEQSNGVAPFNDEDSGSVGGDIIIQIDGEEVFKVVSRQVANGAVLGEGGV